MVISHLTLRHRTAADGAQHSIWEYDSERRVVDCVVRMAAAKPLGLVIWVCSEKDPRFGAHLIKRIDETTFRLLRVAYMRHDLRAMPKASAHHDALPPVDLILTHAPSHIADEMSAL